MFILTFCAQEKRQILVGFLAFMVTVYLISNLAQKLPWGIRGNENLAQVRSPLPFVSSLTRFLGIDKAN
jgi:hypothetical protein